MDRTGLTDAQVLCALYNGSRPQGNGILAALCDGVGQMTVEQAQELIDAYRKGCPTKMEQDRKRLGREVIYVDYLHGRVIKTDVAENPLDLRLYDRDCGQGAGERAICAMLDQLTRPG